MTVSASPYSRVVQEAVTTARRAQMDWARKPAAVRARAIGHLRPFLAAAATALASETARACGRPVAEKMASEILPLLDALRFLEKESARILRPRRHGRRGRPLWLRGHSLVVERQPYGVILIVGPGNYPFFLPLVQMLHALVAGNAVVVKPAENCSSVVQSFLRLVLDQSEISSALVQILPETPVAAHEAVRHGIDKAIFTGASINGRAFLSALADFNVPSVMELSGSDLVFVRADADLTRAARAIAFGLEINGGNTCMAPRGVIAHEAIAPALFARLEASGITDLPFTSVPNDEKALEVASLNEHGLGAAIFSADEKAARRFARRLQTGFVTINDIIVPTADPRLPFGGVRASGFGVTRGAEGLLEMTHPQAITVSRARFLPHLEPAQSDDGPFFQSFISTMHGRGLRRRLGALIHFIRKARERS